LHTRDSLAAKINKDSDEVVVHKLDTKFGMRKTIGYAKVYDSPQSARQVEQDYMLKRNKIEIESEDEDSAAEGA
jgi:small subunit ribosomal protein S24e